MNTTHCLLFLPCQYRKIFLNFCRTKLIYNERNLYRKAQFLIQYKCSWNTNWFLLFQSSFFFTIWCNNCSFQKRIINFGRNEYTGIYIFKQCKIYLFAAENNRLTIEFHIFSKRFTSVCTPSLPDKI